MEISKREKLEMRKNCFIDIDEGAPMYRIFSIDRLLEMFLTGKLTLVKPSKWDDPFENFVLSRKVITNDGVQDPLWQIRESLYAQCWYLIAESDAMWRIYSSDRLGVKVKSRAGELFNCIYDLNDDSSSLKCSIGKVKYLPGEHIIAYLKKLKLSESEILSGDGKGIAKTLLIKRDEFRHEHEARIIFMDINAHQIAGARHSKREMFKFEIDPYALIDEIVFDPRVSNDFMETYASTFRKLGYEKTIKKSTLYQMPKIAINL